MKKYHQNSGYTLIETIIVIILIMILLAGSTNMLSQGFNSFFTGKNIINANWQSSIALERMTRDLHAVCSKSDLKIANTNRVKIIDINGETIEYQVSNDKLFRNNQAIADGVQNITFNYYKDDSTELTNLPLSSNLRKQVRYIAVALDVSYNEITFPITTAIYLWNLK